MPTLPTNQYRSLLSSELLKRKAKNSAYSLRAFARDIGISATALSDFLASKRILSKKNAETVAQKLNATTASTLPENIEEESEEIEISGYTFERMSRFICPELMRLRLNDKVGVFDPSPAFKSFGMPVVHFKLPEGTANARIRNLNAKSMHWHLRDNAIHLQFTFEERGKEIQSPFGFSFDVKNFTLTTEIHLKRGLDGNIRFCAQNAVVKSEVKPRNKFSQMVKLIAEREFIALSDSMFQGQMKKIFEMEQTQKCFRDLLLTWARMSTGMPWTRMEENSLCFHEGKLKYRVVPTLNGTESHPGAIQGLASYSQRGYSSHQQEI